VGRGNQQGATIPNVNFGRIADMDLPILGMTVNGRNVEWSGADRAKDGIQ